MIDKIKWEHHNLVEKINQIIEKINDLSLEIDNKEEKEFRDIHNKIINESKKEETFDFSEALKRMKLGKSVRCKSWHDDWSIKIVDNSIEIYNKNNLRTTWKPLSIYLLAPDWMEF